MFKEKKETLIKLSDWHIPFHDQRALETAFNFCHQVSPTYIVIDEMIDFYSISKFTRNPERKLDLQRDIDMTVSMLKKLRNLCPKSRIIALESNHDLRLQSYLRRRAEEFSSLRFLQIDQLLGFKQLGIEYRKVYNFHGVIIKHGDIVRSYSGYTATAELQREGSSGVSGHTHRLGISFYTRRDGTFFWIEGGCLCNKELSEEYVKGYPNWQLGFSALIYSNNNITPIIIPINNNYKVEVKL